MTDIPKILTVLDENTRQILLSAIFIFPMASLDIYLYYPDFREVELIKSCLIAAGATALLITICALLFSIGFDIFVPDELRGKLHMNAAMMAVPVFLMSLGFVIHAAVPTFNAWATSLVLLLLVFIYLFVVVGVLCLRVKRHKKPSDKSETEGSER